MRYLANSATAIISIVHKIIWTGFNYKIHSWLWQRNCREYRIRNQVTVWSYFQDWFLNLEQLDSLTFTFFRLFISVNYICFGKFRFEVSIEKCWRMRVNFCFVDSNQLLSMGAINTSLPRSSRLRSMPFLAFHQQALWSQHGRYYGRGKAQLSGALFGDSWEGTTIIVARKNDQLSFNFAVIKMKFYHEIYISTG